MSDSNTIFGTGLVDGLASLGVEHACITPGSRSTPLALAFADDDRITDWSHHDERSSAFFALGIAATTGRPVVVLTTSGTAATELYPAATEARYGRIPLILITADRPSELRDVGAPQTIDQRDLFGRMALMTHSIDVDDRQASIVGELAARLVATATGPAAGPAHLSTGFREPLVGGGHSPVTTHLPDTPELAPLLAPDVTEALAAVSGRRGILVVGPQADPAVVAKAAQFADRAGWPILADPLSGLRAGTHDLTAVIAHGDALAVTGWIDGAGAEAVVRVGALPTSKATWQWLERSGVPQVFIEPHGWRDPTGSATIPLRSDPAASLDALAAGIDPAPASWHEQWATADTTAGAAIADALAEAPFPSEPGIARLLADALPDPSTLWVASSMPVRDVDAFFGVAAKSVRILANRGVNGIDGFLSTGLGSAAVSPNPTVLLAGDLSALHDLTALATAARLSIPATIVVINNDGGGIFHFLPQEGHRHFERHFGTPHGLSFATIAPTLGVPAELITEQDDLVKALGDTPTGPRLLEVVTDRHENVELHRAITRAVREALEE